MRKIADQQLYQLIVAHLKEIIREPAVLFWGVVFPILMAWGLGIAFTEKKDVKGDIAIVNMASASPNDVLLGALKENTSDNKSFILDLKNEKLGNYKLTFHETDWNDALASLKKGIVSIIIDYSTGKPEFHFDPAGDESKTLYQLIKGVQENGTAYYSENEAQIKPLTLTGTRYIDFLIPGLLSMGIMMASSWGISYTLIERRSKKLLRRMVATPMKKSNLLIGLISARFFMNVFEAILLCVFAWIYFGTKIQGNLSALVALFIAGNIAFSGIAVLISSHTSNPEVGNGLINAVVTPMMVVSGVFFSYHHFPE